MPILPANLKQHPTSESSPTYSQSTCLLARYGWQGLVGRLALSEMATDAEQIRLMQRGERIIVDVGRGLETAESLGPCRGAQQTTGVALRVMTGEDQLLHAQLQQLGQLARDRAASWLSTTKTANVLLNVEPLLDGRTLLFHFLNQVDEVVQLELDHLIRLYEEEVASDPFVQKVIRGCGPNCGSPSAIGSGCKSSSTSACSNCRRCHK